jgi:YD repeat-containing protein
MLDAHNPKLSRTETTYNGVGMPADKKSPLWFKLRYPIPTRSYEYDAWRNVIKEKNSLGKVTDNEYNHHNQLTLRQLPETDIWDEHGNATRGRPTTCHGYNAQEVKIGTIDPNGHTKGFVLDQAGQWIEKYLGDGTRDTARTLDPQGCLTGTTDAANKHWSYEKDLLGNTITVKSPDPNKSFRYQLDERGNRMSECNALSHETRYIYDARNNVSHLILPGGQCTKSSYDRNHQPLEIINPDNHGLIWERDYFGKEKIHRDLSGKKYDYAYISGYKKSQSSQDLHERKCHQFDGTVQYLDQLNKDYDPAHQFPVPVNTTPQLADVSKQEINYEYEYGSLKKLIDIGTGKYEEYETDFEGRNAGIKYYRLTDKTLLRQVETQYDEIGRESKTYNKQLSINAYLDEITCKWKYDAASNRRALSYKLNATGLSVLCPPPVIEEERWNTFDAANRVLINGGKLESGNIVIDKGGQFSYENNLRTGERYWWDNRYIDATLSYTDEGHLWKTQCNGYDLSTSLEYNLDDTVKVFDVRRAGHTDSRQTIFSVNGLVAHETLTKDGSLYSDTSNTLDEARGLATAQDINYPSLKSKSHVDYGYIAGENWLLDSASGSYTNPNGTNRPTPAQFVYDSNFGVQSKIGSSDEPEVVQTFQTASDGTILNKRTIVNPETALVWKDDFSYIYNANKEIIGAYQKTYPTHIPGSSGGSYENETSLQLAHHLGHVHHDPHIFDTAITPLVSYNELPVLAFPKQDADLNSALNGPHNQLFPQSVTIQTYVVKKGDTFKQISQSLTGETTHASRIARVNGYDTSQHAITPK